VTRLLREVRRVCYRNQMTLQLGVPEVEPGVYLSLILMLSSVLISL
jgi:hypothetical protein